MGCRQQYALYHGNGPRSQKASKVLTENLTSFLIGNLGIFQQTRSTLYGQSCLQRALSLYTHKSRKVKAKGLQIKKD